MARGKKQSKRLSARKRYKVEHNVREHRRKVKKAAKELAKKGIKKGSKKDPGIPNLYPFKEQLLRQMEERKLRIEQDRERRKLERHEELSKRRDLKSIQADAERRAEEFNNRVLQNAEEANNGQNEITEQSRKQYYKEFKKVVEAADVILQVLDARDPLGCRCLEVERAIFSSGSKKKLVLLLNKIDLIPRDNIEKWLKYLRNELPAIAFKASTQSQKDHIARSKVAVTTASKNSLNASICYGADTLMKLLSNYCRNLGLKTSITVGVVGLPNVGKSSVINSLKRSRACTVGSEPGVTKNMQEINLDKHIKLLDSPGIVMSKRNDNTGLILRNCVKLDEVQDPIPAVEAILKRCNRQQIMEKYCIPEYNNVNDFLSLLAHRLGRLKKGGIPNVEAAAKSILTDWNSGKISYYTHPPEQHKLPSHISAEIVTEWSQAFDINTLLSDERQNLRDLAIETDVEMTDAVGLNPNDLIDEESIGSQDEYSDDDDDDEEAMSMSEDEVDDNNEDELVTVQIRPKKSLSEPLVKQKGSSNSPSTSNIPIEKLRKKQLKKQRKETRRQEARLLQQNPEKDPDAMNDSDDAYNFATDFY